MDPVRTINSLKAISKVIFAFTLLFIGAYFFKLFTINENITNHFKLILSGTDILPLYKINFVHFCLLSGYEAIRIIMIALAFYYFIQFLNSLNMADPFMNMISKKHINKVAILSILFFAIDAVGTLHLSCFEKELTINGSINLFHFEYLFLAYFINVFAIIFKRGIDLKNEINLVI